MVFRKVNYPGCKATRLTNQLTIPFSYHSMAWFLDRTLQSKIPLLGAGLARATERPIFAGSCSDMCLSWKGCEFCRHVKMVSADMLFCRSTSSSTYMEYRSAELFFLYSDFILPFLPPYMGVIPTPKMALIFQISRILVLVFPIFMIYFPKCEGKGSFPKSQIKSLLYMF